MINGKTTATDARQDDKRQERLQTPTSHLQFLDGLRGLAALYVVLFHILNQYDRGSPLVRTLSPLTYYGTWWLRYGHWAVDIFIVLSGYCLMIPVVQTTNGRLRGGVHSYLTRRAKRILPPYYAALALSFIPLLAGRVIPAGSIIPVDSWRFNFSPIAILSHLFLVHNWSIATNMQYDSPMWSVSTEWQIYFLFPLLLVIRRRFSIIAAVLAAAMLGSLPHFLIPRYNFDWACPWFLGLFALGMLGAEINFSKASRIVLWRRRMPWNVLAAGLLVAAVILTFVNSGINFIIVEDAIVGAATMCLIVACAEYIFLRNTKPMPIILRILSSKWAVGIGTFSYSLYLIHLPVISSYARILQRFHIGILSTPLVFFSIGIPLSLLAAYLFYLAVERRFTSARRETDHRDAAKIVVSPLL